MAGSAPPTPPPVVTGASPDAAPAPSQPQHSGGGGKGRLVALTAGWVVVVLAAGVWAIGTTVDPAGDEVAAPGASQGTATGFSALTDDADADRPVGFSALADDAGQRSEDATGNTQDGRGFSSIDPGRAADGADGTDGGTEHDTDTDSATDSDGESAADTNGAPRTSPPDGQWVDELDLDPIADGYRRHIHGSQGFLLDLPEGWQLVRAEVDRVVYRGEDATLFAADNVFIDRARGVADGPDDLAALSAHHERILEPYDEVELLGGSDEQVRTFALGERRVYEATTYRTLQDRDGEFMARTRILVATGGDVISVTYTSGVDRFSEHFSANEAAFDSFEVAW